MRGEAAGAGDRRILGIGLAEQDGFRQRRLLVGLASPSDTSVTLAVLSCLRAPMAANTAAGPPPITTMFRAISVVALCLSSIRVPGEEAGRYRGFGAGSPVGCPRGESWFDMHFAMKLLRAAPVSF
jgi:hypothetical protein